MSARRHSLGLSVVLLAGTLFVPATASANPIDWAGDRIGGAISGVAGDGVRAITQWAADGAAWLVIRCFDTMSDTTDPRVSSAWFAESYARMTLIAVGLSAPCFLLGLLQALIHRDGAILARVVMALPLSALLTGGAVGVTQLLLGATDEASRWLVAASGHDLAGFGTTLAKAFVVAPGASLFVVFLVALFAAVCALVLWIELLIRAALVYVLLGFFPLVAAAMVWPAAAAGVRRVVRLLVAVILSKLVAVGVVCMGVAAVGSDGSAESQFQGLLVGCGMIGLACLSPMAVHRLLPLLEESVQVRGNVSLGGASRGVLQTQGTFGAAQRARSALSAGRAATNGGPGAGAAGDMRVAGRGKP